MLCNVMLRYVMLCMYVCVCVCAKVHLRNLHQVVVACVGSCPSFQLLVLRKARWAVESGQDSNSKEAQSGWVSGTMCQHCGLVLRDVSWAQFGPTLWGFIGVLNSTDHSCMCKVIDTDTAWVLGSQGCQLETQPAQPT